MLKDQPKFVKWLTAMVMTIGILAVLLGFVLRVYVILQSGALEALSPHQPSFQFLDFSGNLLIWGSLGGMLLYTFLLIASLMIYNDLSVVQGLAYLSLLGGVSASITLRQLFPDTQFALLCATVFFALTMAFAGIHYWQSSNDENIGGET